jgi:hypothetical protein
VQTPYWIEPDLASSVMTVPLATPLSFVQLQPVGVAGTIVPAAYSLDTSTAQAHLLCTFVLPTDVSATSIVAVTSDSLVIQAAYPTPTDRSVFMAAIGSGATTCGVFSLVELPKDAARSRLRGSGIDRQWVSASANKQGSHAIVSMQSPSTPSSIYLTELVTTAPATPTLLLSNSGLSALVGPLPLPTREFLSVPSAVAGVSLNAYVYKPADFDASQRYPALMCVKCSMVITFCFQWSSSLGLRRYVYGGPGSQTVMSTYPVSGTTNKFLLWMASQGYVVMSVDGRGTGAR